MNNFQISWIDNEGLELYSDCMDYKNAVNLFNDICKEKIIINQVYM